MVTWLRHRLRSEAGISLVEMMVALFILAVVMFGLLGGLIASATSVLDQQLRAEATRIATQTLEGARFAGFDDLDPGSTTQTVVTANGREMTLEQSVEYMDAFDPVGGASEDVKLVTVVVSWSDRGRDREVLYTTAVSPEEPEIVGGQLLIVDVSPGAVEVDADGTPQATVTVTATPQAFTHVGNMTARWYRQDGTLATALVPRVGMTDTWQVDLPAADLVWALDHGDSTDVSISVYAATREGAALLTLFRPGDPAPGPALTAPTVSPDPILLNDPPLGSTNCGTSYCVNVDPVLFSVQVTPFDDEQVIDEVIVETDLRDATGPEEFRLVRQDDEITWSLDIPAGTTQFAPGSLQPFNFYAIYDGGQQSVTLLLLREVRHQ